MIGLAPKSLEVFQIVSQLFSINDFVLVGGTSISIRLNHRLSEDLDFCKWVPFTNSANGIDAKAIETELKSKFKEVKTNHLDFDQVDFYIKGVKISFFNEVGFKAPDFTPIVIEKNLRTVPLEVIGAMKIKTMFQRNTFRDYYDIFVLLKEGIISIKQLVQISIAYDSKLNNQMILNRLNQWEKVIEEKAFHQLSPKYNFSSKEIGDFIKSLPFS